MEKKRWSGIKLTDLNTRAKEIFRLYKKSSEKRQTAKRFKHVIKSSKDWTAPKTGAEKYSFAVFLMV